MKLLLLFLLLNITLFANDSKREFRIGAGAFIQTQPYINVDAKVTPSPVIFFDNELFYIRWSRAGIYFLGNKTDDFSWAFSLTLQPRIYGYDSSDIQGMSKREETWEGGLAFSASKDSSYIEVMLVHDLLNKHDSWILKTELGYDFKLGDFSIYPSLILVYQSEEFLNYYYGVTKTEALRRAEVAYEPSAGFQLGVQTFIEYPINSELSALLNLRADRLPSSASRSSIVEDKYIFSGLASLIYKFTY